MTTFSHSGAMRTVKMASTATAMAVQMIQMSMPPVRASPAPHTTRKAPTNRAAENTMGAFSSVCLVLGEL